MISAVPTELAGTAGAPVGEGKAGGQPPFKERHTHPNIHEGTSPDPIKSVKIESSSRESITIRSHCKRLRDAMSNHRHRVL